MTTSTSTLSTCLFKRAVVVTNNRIRNTFALTLRKEYLVQKLRSMSDKNTSISALHPTRMLRGLENMEDWVLGNDGRLYSTQSRAYLSDESTQESDQSSDEDPDNSSQSSCSTTSDSRASKKVQQLEGLFQIPKKHLLPVEHPSLEGYKPTNVSSASSRKSTDHDEQSRLRTCADVFNRNLVESSTTTSYRLNHSRGQFVNAENFEHFVETRPFSPRGGAILKDSQPPGEPELPSGQQLTASVLAIRKTWASLEANRGPEKHQTKLQLITDLSRRISVDGCTLFEYHISHLLPGDNHAFRMSKLWLSLSAGQNTYWRKHSSKFQLPLAFEFWQLALRNLETGDHEERYSSIVRKAKRILQDASVDSEGCLIASPNWRHPVPENELQLVRLDRFAATRKIQRRLHAIQKSLGERKKLLCRCLAPFIGSSGWTIFAYHGIPRVEELDEVEAMAKLRAIWSGMTADDRIYWIELSGRLLERLKCGNVEALTYFSFDAWAVREARMSAEAWTRLLV